MKRVPLSILERSVIADIKMHLTSNAAHGTLLLPLFKGTVPVQDTFRVALEYRAEELTPSFFESTVGNILGDIATLPKSTRVPYTLFMYSDVFHNDHQRQLQCGHSTHALIQKLTTMRK